MKPEDIQQGIEDSFKKILHSADQFQRQGSNWVLDGVVEIHINMAEYRPLWGSSYIPLPRNLRNKKAIINVKNHDKRCLQWSLLATLYPAKRNPEDVRKYREYISKLKFGDVKFSANPGDIPKVEKLNDISINLFGFEKGNVFPIHITVERTEKHVNLLLISDGKKSQYCYIKNLDRFLSDQTKCSNRSYHCPYCLHEFYKEKLVTDHIDHCKIHGPQKVEVPTEKDKWLFFSDVAK